MIGGLKPYPEYRDSCVPWLGHAPKHWDIKRAKCCFREADDRSATGDEELMSVSHITGVTPRSQKNITMFLAESNIGHKLCEPNDIVVNTMWAWMAALGVARQRGIVSPSYAVYRPLENNGLLPEYVDRLLRTQAYASEYYCASTGINTSRLRLYPEQFLRIAILRPPQDEQAFIVRFLDHADRGIRRYIRAKQKLIKLLEEQKQAVIHRAVTRGLDPNVRLKPSGIEWLGDVPEHWGVLALKRVLRRLIDCEHKTAPAVDSSEFRVVRTTAVRFGKLRLEGTYCTTAETFAQWTWRGTPEVGDVIFTREAPAGEACLVPPDHRVCLGQRTVLMKPKRDRYDPMFLVQMIYGGPPADRIRLASRGSTVGHFNMDDIADLRVLVPPLFEQQAIVAAIADWAKPLEDAMDRAGSEISLLREYRTRLIADVVTGKLDVREAAANLPHEADEPAALDDSEAPAESDEDATETDLDVAPEEAEA